MQKKLLDANTMYQPFIKYHGGKRRYVKSIENMLPPNIGLIHYIEPCVGGGALFWHLLSQGKIKSAFLSDINPDLICLYIAIKNNIDDVVECVKHHQLHHSKEYYLSLQRQIPTNLVERGAWFFYMIQCGFNGKAERSKDGFYLSGWGDRSIPKNFDITFRQCHEGLNSTYNILYHGHYKSMDYPPGSFVFFDPPYFNTTGYGGDFDHEELKEFIDLLTEDGRFVLQANSDSEYIRDLYSDYHMSTIPVVYDLGAKKGMPNTRSRDLYISNYDANGKIGY